LVLETLQLSLQIVQRGEKLRRYFPQMAMGCRNSEDGRKYQEEQNSEMELSFASSSPADRSRNILTSMTIWSLSTLEFHETIL
jgi:hypothetical protein